MTVTLGLSSSISCAMWGKHNCKIKKKKKIGIIGLLPEGAALQVPIYH